MTATNITKDAVYEAVAPDDFEAMLNIDRYGERSGAFDKIIAATHDHFWDPLDPRYIDFDQPFDMENIALLPEEISRLLSPLDDREREILKLRFGLDRGEPRTLEEVGEHFNLTRERIRQIEARAMSKLRHPSSDTGARDLLAV